MNQDNNNAEAAPTATTSLSQRISGFVLNGVAYTLFGLGILGFYTFFAPFLGTPTIDLITELLPTIAAPTEAEGVVVNASPLIAGVVATFAGVWLR
ncbi:hypothetical protein [Halorubrum sp. FL23]|uniref:hypothetical protein n=1 Tax=Halorubrum sp. FL23 TaxID=3458704 RepID=UPI0040347DEC